MLSQHGTQCSSGLVIHDSGAPGCLETVPGHKHLITEGKTCLLGVLLIDLDDLVCEQRSCSLDMCGQGETTVRVLHHRSTQDEGERPVGLQGCSRPGLGNAELSCTRQGACFAGGVVKVPQTINQT